MSFWMRIGKLREAVEPDAGTGGTPPVVAPVVPGPEPTSNADVKAHPLFVKLAEQVATLTKTETERTEAATKATKDAELKKAAEEGRFEDALKQRDADIDTLKADHASALQTRDLETALLKAGFFSDIFVRGAVAGYGTDSGTIEEYAAALAADEANKGFLAQSDPSRSPLPAPGKAPVKGGAAPSWDEVKAWETGTDKEKKTEARTLIAAYRKEHGTYPYSLT